MSTTTRRSGSNIAALHAEIDAARLTLEQPDHSQRLSARVGSPRGSRSRTSPRRGGTDMTATSARTFSVRDILAELVESGVIDHGDLASKTLAAIPPEHYRDALEQVLRGYCTAYLGECRRRPVVPPTPAGQMPSVKQARIRDAWAEVCRKPLTVGEHHVIPLGEASAADLRYAQSESQARAAEHAAWARRYGEYAGLLDEHGVTRIADLPEPARARIVEDWSR